MKANQTIVLYMNDGVECGTAKSILEAYKLMKDNKELDAEHGWRGLNKYWFELQEEDGDTLYTCCVKIYRRGKKVFMRYCDYPEC